MSEYEKSEMERGTNRVKREWWILVCRGCYDNLIVLVDNY